MRRRAPFVSLLALPVLACGARAPSGPTTPQIALAGGVRDIAVLTDLEEVRDVAASGTAIYVATDTGVLVYTDEGGGVPRRIGRAQGLPSDDVLAVAVESDGAVLVATAEGLAAIRGESVVRIADVPEHQRVMDLVIQGDGTAWLCTLSGLLRRRPGEAWARFGEPTVCTTLAPTPEGHLWVGTANGLLYVEGEVIREHPVSGGIPEGYVRAIAPVLPGQILALLNGPSRAQIGFWDGRQWYGYTLPDVAEPVVGLVLRGGSDATLVTRDRAFSIAPTGAGTALRPLSARPGNVRSFRVAAEVETGSAPAPAAAVDAVRVLRPVQPLAEVPTSGPTPTAPRLVATPIGAAFPRPVYRAFQSGDRAFAAAGNAGVVELPRRGELRSFRSRSLVPEGDLQVATDIEGGVWVRARNREIARWVEGRLRRLALPDDVAPQALASGAGGAYLVALVPGTRTVRVYVAEGGGFRPLLERTLAVAVEAIPFAGIAPDGKVWIAIAVRREDGVGTRTRGVAVLDPRTERVVYHHRGAPHGQGLPLPDEVSAVTFDGAGNAWFATLSGAVRVEEYQAIVFDETRGVRGEVVTDVASGAGRMWIAAAEGLGSYANRQFDFHQPPVVRQHRPTAVASDAAGHLWAAGPTGLLHHDGAAWHHYGTAEGLPTDTFHDVEIDGAHRVWLLAEDAVLVLSPQ
jgi:hypothetical protein